MNEHRPVSEADLHAYADGFLDQADCRRVEEHLAENPEMARMVADWQAQNDGLKNAFAPYAISRSTDGQLIAGTAVPQDLFDTILQEVLAFGIRAGKATRIAPQLRQECKNFGVERQRGGSSAPSTIGSCAARVRASRHSKRRSCRHRLRPLLSCP